MHALRRVSPLLISLGMLLVCQKAASAARVDVPPRCEATPAEVDFSLAPPRMDAVALQARDARNDCDDAIRVGTSETRSMLLSGVAGETFLEDDLLLDEPRPSGRTISAVTAAPAFEPDSSRIPQAMLIPLPSPRGAAAAGLATLLLIRRSRFLRRIL